jgi:hypothetical protein
MEYLCADHILLLCFFSCCSVFVKEIVQDELRIDGIISAKRPSMDLETTSTVAGTDKGMQVASVYYLGMQ